MRHLYLLFPLLLLISCGKLKIQEKAGEYGTFCGVLIPIEENEILAKGSVKPFNKLLYYPKKVEYNVLHVDSFLMNIVTRDLNREWSFIFYIDTIYNNEVYIDIVTVN